MSEVYTYAFDSSVAMDEVQASLLLALLATESLHGESQVRLDATHYLDTDRRACVIDAGTTVGRDVNRLFVGFLQREFGAECFSVKRIEKSQEPQVVGPAV